MLYCKDAYELRNKIINRYKKERVKYLTVNCFLIDVILFNITFSTRMFQNQKVIVDDIVLSFGLNILLLIIVNMLGRALYKKINVLDYQVFKKFEDNILYQTFYIFDDEKAKDIIASYREVYRIKEYKKFEVPVLLLSLVNLILAGTVCGIILRSF